MVTCITDRHPDIRLIKQATPVSGLSFLSERSDTGVSVSGEGAGRHEVREEEVQMSPNERKSGKSDVFFSVGAECKPSDSQE